LFYYQEEAEEKAALMVIGNKVDLSEDSNTRVVTSEVAESLAKVSELESMHPCHHNISSFD